MTPNTQLTLDQQISQLRHDLANKQTAAGLLEEQVTRLQAENEALREEVKELTETLSSANAVYREQAERLTGLTEEIEALRNQVTALQGTALTTEWAYVENSCPRCFCFQEYGHAPDCEYTTLRTAGYLAQEVRP